ncbi:MAG: type II toxin-antitoxin system VapC family toxin [Acidobacteriota bacterium]
MIVLDASAAVDLLLGNDSASIEARVFAHGEEVHAPHLLDIEVASVLRRLAWRDEVTAVRAGQAMEDFIELPIHRHAHERYVPRIWELRFNLTAYDAVYVALAEVLGVPLLTRDRKLTATAGHEATVELV